MKNKEIWIGGIVAALVTPIILFSIWQAIVSLIMTLVMILVGMFIGWLIMKKRLKLWVIGGIGGLAIGVALFNIWIIFLWPLVLIIALIGMFIGWLIMKKKFIILTIFILLLILFITANIIRPLEGKEMPNKPFFEFLCDNQYKCRLFIEPDYYVAKTTNDKCKRCYPSGCNIEHEYGPPAKIGEIIDRAYTKDYQKAIQELESGKGNDFSPDCEYEIELTQHDKSKGNCRCEGLITM